jgi:hypothetical protein
MAALTGHKKRFAGWQKCAPQKTQYLVEQVLARIVPEFEKYGFVWCSDNSGVGANSILLQKREGDEWPTVGIDF